MNPYRPPSVADSFAPHAPEAPQGSALTPGVMEAMRQTRPWVTFLAILGFLGATFFLVAALGMIVVGGASVRVDAFRGFTTLGVGFAYLVFVPAYLVPSFQLFRYGTDIKRFLRGGGVPALEDALRSQKTFWKLVGYFATGTALLFLVGFLVLVAFGVARGGFL